LEVIRHVLRAVIVTHRQAAGAVLAIPPKWRRMPCRIGSSTSKRIAWASA
jgi:hypothetical protein